jgi:hypothetical protein
VSLNLYALCPTFIFILDILQEIRKGLLVIRDPLEECTAHLFSTGIYVPKIIVPGGSRGFGGTFFGMALYLLNIFSCISSEDLLTLYPGL